VKTVNMTQSKNFWQWFNSNRHLFRQAAGDRLVLDLILAKLREIDPGLFFEMSLDAHPKEFMKGSVLEK